MKRRLLIVLDVAFGAIAVATIIIGIISANVSARDDALGGSFAFAFALCLLFPAMATECIGYFGFRQLIKGDVKSKSVIIANIARLSFAVLTVSSLAYMLIDYSALTFTAISFILMICAEAVHFWLTVSAR